MTKLADYLELLERLLNQENDILIKYDKAKKIIKLQYYAPTTLKLEDITRLSMSKWRDKP